MKAQPNQNLIITRDLRDRLKSIVESEIQSLPDLLNALEGKERLDVILRLIPFVIPKVQPVESTAGEPFTLEW